MPSLTLSKHHALGNDFLVYLDPDGRTPLTAELARALCDRHRGVGADGLIRGGPARDGADLSFELRNSDGSDAEMSGNGMRCLVQAAVDAGLVVGPAVDVATVDGVRAVRIDHETGPGLRQASVDMGAAKVEQVSGGPGAQSAEVTIGNPHLVVVDNEESIDLEAVAHRYPNQNVELISITDRSTLKMRVWERGAGLTEACGTGSCASAAAAVEWDLVDRRVDVHNPGGILTVEVGETIVLRGPTEHIATVEVRLP